MTPVARPSFNIADTARVRISSQLKLKTALVKEEEPVIVISAVRAKVRIKTPAFAQGEISSKDKKEKKSKKDKKSKSGSSSSSSSSSDCNKK